MENKQVIIEISVGFLESLLRLPRGVRIVAVKENEDLLNDKLLVLLEGFGLPDKFKVAPDAKIMRAKPKLTKIDEVVWNWDD